MNRKPLSKEEYLQAVHDRLQVLYQHMITKRKADEDSKTTVSSCLKFCRNETMTLLLWSLDTKNGLGEESYVHQAIGLILELKLSNEVKSSFFQALERMKRWDIVVDYIPKMRSRLIHMIAADIYQALKSHSVACAANMPRRGDTANRIRGMAKVVVPNDIEYFAKDPEEFTPKEWRSVLTPLCRNQIEVLMSDRKWSEIKYEDLPLLLICKYQKAFRKHDKARFESYVAGFPERIQRFLKSVKPNSRPAPKRILTYKEALAQKYYKPPKRQQRKS